jgi:acetoin reductase-like protein
MARTGPPSPRLWTACGSARPPEEVHAAAGMLTVSLPIGTLLDRVTSWMGERRQSRALRTGFTAIKGAFALGILDHKRAIVTGAGQGIGRGIAVRFAAEGAAVGVADISADNARAVVREIEAAGGAATALAMDVRDRAAVEQAISDFAGPRYELDILVNNAGVIRTGPFLEIDGACWDYVMDVNCKGTLWCSQAAATAMIEQGRGGRIINLASQAGRRGEANAVVYCASKASIVSMTQSMALALAAHGITVNALAPGIVDTPMWDDIDRRATQARGEPTGEAKRRAVSTIPIGRIGRPEDVAGAALFLASGDGEYVTQQCLNVDGGNWPS